MTFRRTRCPHCKAKLEAGQRIHMECIDGYADAQAEKLKRAEAKRERAAARVERAEDRRRRESLETIPKLIAKAQVAFNAFIRERDRHKGCFVCGCVFSDEPGKVMHAGHVRSRGAAGHLRFHEDNCLGECEGCNGPHGAKPHQIKAGAIARIGAAKFEQLEADNEPVKWDRDTLREITVIYRAKLRQMKKGI